jgi:hypothetical protein
MTTTSTATVKPLKMIKLRAQVLAGIAAGEVRRVKIGNTTRIQWFKPEGHELGWGRTHGKLFTRWPTHTVQQLVDAGLASFTDDGTVLLTRKGKALLA